MRRSPFLLLHAAGLIAAAALGAGVSGAALARGASHTPVVVELYTAQGCAGCPQADRLLEQIGQRKGVIALTFPVDYWDYLGWADTFAQPGFSARQRAYADKLKVREIYTPEAVVNGHTEAQGVDQAAIEALIKADARALADGPTVQLTGARVRIRAGRAAAPRSDVWLVRYDPSERSVKVKAGDNKGKTVVQRYVVRELTRLGGYSGGAKSFAVPKAAQDGLQTLVLVQGVKGGRIIGVGQG